MAYNSKAIMGLMEEMEQIEKRERQIKVYIGKGDYGSAIKANEGLLEYSLGLLDKLKR